MMKRPKNRELQYLKSFGDAGRIQKALDSGRCPKCLVTMPPAADDGSLKCYVCKLSIGGQSDMPEVSIKKQSL